MKKFLLLFSIALFWLAPSCFAQTTEGKAVTFAFRIHGLGAAEEFRIRTTSRTFIKTARQQLLLPRAERHLFPIGPIAAGNRGNNNWSWHYTDASLAEMSIELCDGRPSMVEADLEYWLGTVKSFCPWGGFVYAEVK